MENFRLSNEERLSIAERVGEQVAKLPRQEQKKVTSALQQCVESLGQRVSPNVYLPRGFFTTYKGKSTLAYYLLLLLPERNFLGKDTPLNELQGTRLLNNEEKFALARQVGVFVETLTEEEQDTVDETLRLCVWSLRLQCNTDCLIRPKYFNSYSQRCVLSYYMLWVFSDTEPEPISQ